MCKRFQCRKECAKLWSFAAIYDLTYIQHIIDVHAPKNIYAFSRIKHR